MASCDPNRLKPVLRTPYRPALDLTHTKLAVVEQMVMEGSPADLETFDATNGRTTDVILTCEKTFQ
jgi:hypothetical protein